MSLRHAVLGLLAVEPSTGYELTRRFDRSLANAWHASHSQIYPALAQLERAGMVEVVSEGARRSRTWAVTDGGRAELRDWLVEREPDRGQRNESGVRCFLFQLLEPDDRRVALEQELAYMLQSREQLRATSAKVAAEIEQGRQPAFARSVGLGLRIQEVIIAWLQEQLDELRD